MIGQLLCVGYWSSMLSLQLCCRSLANGNINAQNQIGTYFSTVHVIRLHLGKEAVFPALFLIFLALKIFHSWPNPIYEPPFPDLHDEICMQNWPLKYSFKLGGRRGGKPTSMIPSKQHEALRYEMNSMYKQIVQSGETLPEFYHNCKF